MNDEKVWDEFPNKIDLGREETICSPCAPAQTSSKSKEEKRTYYPSLYVNGVDGLEGLEKEGWALIRYRTRSLTVRADDDKENNLNGGGPSVDLEIRELCLPADATPEGEALGKAIAKFAKKKGYDTEGAEGGTDDQEPKDDEEET